tara:strand:- start:64 stop:813 length:750 start_codon:yes stop_codon:yes gene_type:complete
MKKNKYNFLVIVSNHGMGTSYFSSQILELAINNLINVKEPFGGNEQFQPLHFCAKHKNAIFDLDFNKNSKFNLNNKKLQQKFDTSLKWYINHGCEKKQKNIINLAKSLYGKKINDSEFHEKCASLKDYFVNLRKRIIELSNANEIVLSHKIFPGYVNDDFDKVKSYLLKKDVLVVHLKRNYKNARTSNLRRFGNRGADKTDEDWDNFIETEILPNKQKYFQYDVENDLWKSEEVYQSKVEKILKEINNF